MRDALVIFVAIIISIVVGGYLFLNGGQEFNPPTVITTTPTTPSILAEGQHSGEITRRTNFRILNEAELQELWTLVHGETGPIAPDVDFSQFEVIAVFDGTHSTGGHNVKIADIEETNGMRVVHILRESPGENCAVTTGITSPYQIVLASKSSLPITKEEEERINECS